MYVIQSMYVIWNTAAFVFILDPYSLNNKIFIFVIKKDFCIELDTAFISICIPISVKLKK